MTDAVEQPSKPARAKKVVQNPVLAEHRAIFKAHLERWQKELGLDSWRINLSKRKPGRGNAAEVRCYHPDRMAEVRLADDLGGTEVTSENLEAFAVHELSHILLAPLVDQVASGLTGDALAAEEHRVIHTIQKLITRGRI